MSSKMREALEEAYLKGAKAPNLSNWGNEVMEIAQCYGPMFTREEVRGMLSKAVQYERLNPGKHTFYGIADEILSRYTEAEGETKTVEAKIGKRYTREPLSIDDNTPTIKASEPEEEPDLVDAVLDYRTREGMAMLDDLCKRVAAIEKRLLANGHHKRCAWVKAVSWHESTDVDVECTCGHDEIREQAND